MVATTPEGGRVLALVRVGAAGLALLGGGWWAFALEGEEPENTAVVEMTGDRLRFDPPRITIRSGGTVEWRNTATSNQTIAADRSRLPRGAEPFGSGPIEPGKTWSHRFNKPGVYPYFCLPHQGMGVAGVVDVKE